MTWMLIRLVLSLAFVGLVLWFAARVAKKRGLGGGGAHGLIEVVARQRMGRSSSVNVVRIGDVVLVVGATEEQITLLAEVDTDTIDAALHEGAAQPARPPARAAHPAPAPRHPREEYDGYDEQVAAGDPYDGPGYGPGYGEAYAAHDDGYAEEYAEPYADALAERGREPRRSGGHHADHHADHRSGGGVHRPAAPRTPSTGPLAGSVFDKNGWGGFVNELRERTVRRP